MSSTLELDQDDITARLVNDAVTGQVAVFSQRKGITENDVQTRLGSLNSKNGITGLVLIVLMPKLIPQEANTPAPMYATRYSVQVIDWPAIRRQSVGGAGISAESMAERVRQILHFAGFGRGQSLFFDGLEPLPMRDENQVSYAISFRKMGADTAIQKCAVVGISPNTGTTTTTITLSCATFGAAIWYTTDGSYPASTNPTAVLYSAPFSMPGAGTLRAAAEKMGLQQSDPSQGIYVLGIQPPTGLGYTNLTDNSLTLIWEPALGGLPGVQSYVIFQDGVQIGTSVDPTFDVTGLDGATAYEFTVKAVDGIPETSAASDPVDVTTEGTAVVNLFHLIITGQSNSIGVQAVPLLSTANLHPRALMFNAGPFPGGVGLTSLVPLVGVVDGNIFGETIGYAMAYRLAQLNPDAKILITHVGLDGQRYLALKKGTQPYADSISQVTAAAALAAGEGLAYRCIGVCAVHGEADQEFANSGYVDDLQEWQVDYNTDIKVAGGQTDTIPLFACQQCSLSPDGVEETSSTACQLFRASIADPLVVLASPRYMLDHPQQPHFTNWNHRLLGEQYAKVIQAQKAGSWVPFRPIEVVRQVGSPDIVLSMPVSHGPLALDLVNVALVENTYGFSYHDDSSSAAVQSVAITGPNEITVTLDGVPTGTNPKLRYACAEFGPSGGVGKYGTSRGNICDSDPFASNFGFNLVNRLPMFSVDVTEPGP